MRLSKTSLIILSAGVFVVILAGLGLTRSQQAKEQTELNDELSLIEMRLDKLEFTQQQQELVDLQEQLDDNTILLAEDKDRLRQTVESIDVTDEFFLIASYCDVEIVSYSSTKITPDDLKGITCATIGLNATVTGKVTDLLNFIISLNHDFTSGVVESAQMTISESSDGAESTASIQMSIYSYKGA